MLLTHSTNSSRRSSILNCDCITGHASIGFLLRIRPLQGMTFMPTPVNGKICYIEMPATDVPRSADFYQKVFGWNMRKRGDGATAFDDTTGEVSGAFVRGRPPAAMPGLLLYIMVDNVENA